jgi:hypothetical protein
MTAPASELLQNLQHTTRQTIKSYPYSLPVPPAVRI